MGQLSHTTDELDALLTGCDGRADTNYRIKDGVFQIKDTNDGKYRTVWFDSGELKRADTGEV